MFQWFASQPQERQQHLLQLTARQGPAARHRHQQEEKDVLVAVRQKMETSRLKAQQAEKDQARQKAAILAEVRGHGGPCSSSSDVDSLLERADSQKDGTAVLKAEIRFFKKVLGFNSPFLKQTQTLPELTAALKSFLDEQQPLIADNNQDNCLNMSAEEDELSQSQESALQEDIPVFTFRQVGQHVAVFYDETFHIGDVINILNEDEAEIRFMKKSSVNKNIYIWPQKEDKDVVDSMFVFAWDFDVETSKGRTWTASTPDHTPTLEERYEAY